IKFGGRPIEFEVPLPKGGGKTLRGNLLINNQLLPVRLEATKLESPDADNNRAPTPLTYEQAKEVLPKGADDPRVFEAATTLFRGAKANKATADEVKGWAETVVKAGEAYGPRWRQEVVLRVASLLAMADGYPAVAEEAAR